LSSYQQEIVVGGYFLARCVGGTEEERQTPRSQDKIEADGFAFEFLNLIKSFLKFTSRSHCRYQSIISWQE